MAGNLNSGRSYSTTTVRSQEYQDGRDYSVTIPYLFEKIKNANKNRGIPKSFLDDCIIIVHKQFIPNYWVTICGVVRGNLCIL